MLGGEGTAPPPNSLGNIPPDHSLRTEGGTANDLPRLLTWPPTPRPADISAVQLVGYQSTREEIWDLYHQLYKPRRLPGSPLCGPEQVCELTRDVVSSLKNCLQ